MLLFRIKSQPGVTYKSVVFLKKDVTLFFYPLKMKKYFATGVYFCVCLCLVFQCGDIVGSLAKKVCVCGGGGGYKKKEIAI